jgi:hypothetical protein
MTCDRSTPSTWRLVGTGIPPAVKLAKLLFDRGDRGALTARADAGDQEAAERLAQLLRCEDYVALVARVEAGDKYAAKELAALHAAHEWLGYPLSDFGFARRDRRRDYDLPGPRQRYSAVARADPGEAQGRPADESGSAPAAA